MSSFRFQVYISRLHRSFACQTLYTGIFLLYPVLLLHYEQLTAPLPAFLILIFMCSGSNRYIRHHSTLVAHNFIHSGCLNYSSTPFPSVCYRGSESVTKGTQFIHSTLPMLGNDFNRELLLPLWQTSIPSFRKYYLFLFR